MYYEVLEKIHSKDAGVYSNLGNIWAIRGNIKKSLEEYTKSLKLDSTIFDTYLDRATTYSNMGELELAIKDYNRAYKINPLSEILLDNRAFTYLNAKQFENSLNDYNKLIQINPDVPKFYFYRGVAESNLGNNKAALADFMRDLNADPKNGNCLSDIAIVYQQMKDYPTALSYALKAKQAGYPVTDEFMKGIQDKINHPDK
jgi:tetratricopeptide (TPR) repeat protein